MTASCAIIAADSLLFFGFFFFLLSEQHLFFPRFYKWKRNMSDSNRTVGYVCTEEPPFRYKKHIVSWAKFIFVMSMARDRITLRFRVVFFGPFLSLSLCLSLSLRTRGGPWDFISYFFRPRSFPMSFLGQESFCVRNRRYDIQVFFLDVQARPVLSNTLNRLVKM